MSSDSQKLRVNFKDTKDIGIITYYEGIPLTGIGFSLIDNRLHYENEMVNGLKNGKGITYFLDGKKEISFYKDDLLFDFSIKDWNELFEIIFTNETLKNKIENIDIMIGLNTIKLKEDFDLHPKFIDNFRKRSIDFLNKKIERNDLVLTSTEGMTTNSLWIIEGLKLDNLKKLDSLSFLNEYEKKLDSLRLKRKSSKNLKFIICSMFKNKSLFECFFEYFDEFEITDCCDLNDTNKSKEKLKKIILEYFPPFHYVDDGFGHLLYEKNKLTLELYNEEMIKDERIKWEITDGGVIEL